MVSSKFSGVVKTRCTCTSLASQPYFSACACALGRGGGGEGKIRLVTIL